MIINDNLKEALNSLERTVDRIRLTQEEAKSILLNNRVTIVNGTVRYFVIRKIGLGICEISLAGPEAKETYFLKE